MEKGTRTFGIAVSEIPLQPLHEPAITQKRSLLLGAFDIYYLCYIFMDFLKSNWIYYL